MFTISRKISKFYVTLNPSSAMFCGMFQVEKYGLFSSLHNHFT